MDHNAVILLPLLFFVMVRSNRVFQFPSINIDDIRQLILARSGDSVNPITECFLRTPILVKIVLRQSCYIQDL